MRRRTLLRLLPAALAGAGLAWLPPLKAAETSQRLRWLAVADTGSGDANQRAVAFRKQQVFEGRFVDHEGNLMQHDIQLGLAGV